MYVLLKFTVPK